MSVKARIPESIPDQDAGIIHWRLVQADRPKIGTKANLVYCFFEIHTEHNPMDKTEIDVDPCDHITSDAIGQPGQRVFYIQAFQAEKTYTVIIEKTQLQSLAVGIEQFLVEVARQNPKLEEASADYVEAQMRISPPVDPVFRVGEIGLGYDETRDLVVLFVREAQGEEQEPESGSVIRFWCTRTQLRKLARWGAEVASRGRPICPQCGQPMEPEGHFCPKKNGHLH